MVVADEVKVVVDNGRCGFARVRSEKSGVRRMVFRRAAIAQLIYRFPKHPPAVSQTLTAFVLELTQAVLASRKHMAE